MFGGARDRGEREIVVNVHIHQFGGGPAVADAAAMEQFQQQWATYQKLVDTDWLSHKAVGDLLGAALKGRFAKTPSRCSILPAAMRA